jgi:TolB-like protein/DNA-binding winged helix-turn-helix (wHTH) protein/tetratricopeptide (TPR) repeat protein
MNGFQAIIPALRREKDRGGWRGEALQQADYPSRRLRFGVFDADLRTGQLSKHGKRLRLQEQPFRLLAILLEQPGELVTREELRGRLWPQTTVDFDHGLNKAVSKIRDALGDSAESPRFIETVARRGYRFLADVVVIDEPPQIVATEVVSKEQPSAVVGDLAAPGVLRVIGASTLPTRLRRALTWGLAGFALVLVLATGGMWFVHSWWHAEAAVRSLVVLPLANFSNDPSQDYFADGMTEELIAQLGQINALRVISRTSAMTYKNARKPLPEIAHELNVDAVVEGSVMKYGDEIRITAQLIEVPADKHIWAQSYAGDVRDTLTLQGRVASAIAGQIRAVLKPQEQTALTTKPRVMDPKAYEAYLKGRYFLNERTGDGLTKAIASFNRAIELDPAFAKAYSGLADAYALAGDWEYGVLSPQEAFAQAKAAATKALALDDQLGEAHTSLAFALDLYGWDWEAAGVEFARAVELNPSYATAHHWYAWHLMMLRRNSEGIFELRRAQNLDPLSPIIGADLADALCIDHRYDDSVMESRKTLELEPNFAIAHYELGQAFEQKHMHGDAIVEFQRAIELSGHNAAFDSNLAYAYAVSGQKAEAARIAKDLEARHDRNPSADANVALIYVGLAEPDQAMIWLNKAYEARFNPSILLRPAWDSLRSDPRFNALLGRIGLPG